MMYLIFFVQNRDTLHELCTNTNAKMTDSKNSQRRSSVTNNMGGTIFFPKSEKKKKRSKGLF